jgi:competence protein ComEA
MQLRSYLVNFAVTLALFILIGWAHSSVAWAALDLNKANAADLDGLKGVGPATSSRILEERKKGSFKDWNDFISRVKGISEKKASSLSAQGLTINDSAFTGSPKEKKNQTKKETQKTKNDKVEKNAEKTQSN